MKKPIDSVFINLCFANRVSIFIAKIDQEYNFKITNTLFLDYQANYIDNLKAVEAIVLKLIDKFEKENDIFISNVNLILPNNYFSIRKHKISHDHKYALQITDYDKFEFYKEAWQKCRDAYFEEEIVGLKTPFVSKKVSQYNESYIKDKIDGVYLSTFVNKDGLAIVDLLSDKINIKVDAVIPSISSILHSFDDSSLRNDFGFEIGYHASTIVLVHNLEIHKVINVNNINVKSLTVKICKAFNLSESKAFNLLNMYMKDNSSFELLDEEFAFIQKSKLNNIIIQSLEEFFIAIKDVIPKDFLSDSIGKIYFDGFLSGSEVARRIAKNVFGKSVYMNCLDNKIDQNNFYVMANNEISIQMEKMSKYGIRVKNFIHKAVKAFVLKVDGIL